MTDQTRPHLDATLSKTGLLRQVLAGVTVIVGLVSGSYTNSGSGHFIDLSQNSLLAYSILLVVFAPLLLLFARLGGMAVGLVAMGILSVLVGMILIMGLGGLLFWVAPSCFIAAAQWTSADRMALPLTGLAVVTTAVLAAALYGAMVPDSGSGFLGSGILWASAFVMLGLATRRDGR